MIKTVILTGKELKVQNLGGFNTVVHNLGDEAIYASKYPNVAAGADNVAEIPQGAAKLISTTNGTVYLLGKGKAELTGQDHDDVNFKQPSSLGGGGTSEVTKAYVDKMLSEKLDAAKEYTDNAFAIVSDDIASLQTDKAERSELPTTLPANGGNADTVNGHTVNADVPADAQFTDTVYTLDAATKTSLGGVKIGDNLSVTADGTLSAPIYSNPNLLDNPDFKINQRGKTEYTTAGYTVDRWCATSGISVKTNGSPNVILTKKSGASGDIQIYQLIEKYNALRGQRVCFSAKINGTVRYVTCVLTSAPSSLSGGASSFDGGSLVIFTTDINSYLGVYIASTSESIPLNIEWAKLELGSAPTPFVPPSPAEELMKCLRYYEKGRCRVRMLAPSVGYNKWFTGIQCIAPKRISPTFKLLNITNYSGINVNSTFFNDITTTSIAASNNDPLKIFSNGILTGKGTIEEGATYTVEYIASADL